MKCFNIMLLVFKSLKRKTNVQKIKQLCAADEQKKLDKKYIDYYIYIDVAVCLNTGLPKVSDSLCFLG